MTNDHPRAPKTVGMHINTTGNYHSVPQPLAWLNGGQEASWKEHGLVLWDESAHCVTHLSPAQALQLLGEINSKPGWQEIGLSIGEPANIIHLNPEDREKDGWQLINIIHLDPSRVQELLDLLQGNQAVLQHMADQEEIRRRQALARAYAEILSWPEPREKGEKGEGNLSCPLLYYPFNRLISPTSLRK